ncbi:MAG: ATP-binding cassette domain-containing protein [Lachnospiraceae bacterium]|nr:ATP-binding cassette domain-containing protein [Lachnospiraceae bacterium]
MSQINVSNLTFCYEGSVEPVFENVSFSIDTDWKLGFVGRNGKGKTTFLRLLSGELEYQGKISSAVSYGYFPYSIKLADWKQCGAELLENWKADCEAWQVLRELDKLQVEAEVLYRPFGTLSFGERTKLMLAVLFSEETNGRELLLVDEPTNHLDQKSREIVKEYLSRKKGFILVSHDRDLLDACVDHMLVLNRKSIEVQAGNFSSWWENKNRKDIFSKMENEKHKKEIGQLQAASARTRKWADKNESTKIGFDPIKEPERNISTRAYIGAKTKKMQSRVKQLEIRIGKEIEEKQGLLQDIENPAELKLMPITHVKKRLLYARDFGLQYQNAEKPVFSNLQLELEQGDRMLLHGGNGCGKSSLIHAILDQIADTRRQSKGENERIGEMENTPKRVEMLKYGILQIASDLKISYISQDTSFLRGSIKAFCREEKLEESLFCSILRQLDMERTQFERPIEEFSEGQKKKVLIAASLLTPANLYIWDEPLNYIDVFSRMQIEKMIMEYQPTMLIVEHDVRFQEKVATKVINLEAQ